MKCSVVTPEKTEVECEASFVAIPLFDGEYGVAPLHTPLVGRIGAGELRIKTPEDKTERYFIEGGFAEVNHDVVSILTNRLLRPGDFDSASAQTNFEEASAKKDSADRAGEIRAARARIRVARKWESK